MNAGKKKGRKLSRQMFLITTTVILAVVVIHALFFRLAFSQLYRKTLVSDVQRRFEQACAQFAGGGESSVNEALQQYAKDNETAVLAVSDDYRLLDALLLSKLNILTVRTDAGEYLKLPVPYMREIPDISLGNTVTIEAARLGDSDIYDPFSVLVNDETYYYKRTSDQPTVTIVPRKTWYTPAAGSKASDRAWMIYEQLKDCLTKRLSIPDCLAALPQPEVSDDAQPASQYFTCSRQVGGQTVYFVTLGTIELSGSEARYMTGFLIALYGVMAAMLAVAIYFLSHWLSRPMVELSDVANRIAKQDFSARARVASRNELGQLAESINSMADSLENAVRELSQTASEAKENAERVKQLLANLAHEFKTPLGIISLYVEVIENNLFEKERSYYFGILNDEIAELTRMVDEAIQLSRLQSGQMEMKFDAYPLDELVTSALAPFTETLQRDGFTLETRLSDAEVWADGLRIKQVLTNLISNAIKYSGPSKEISIFSEPSSDEVIVWVVNRGNISPDDLKRIWERYYRASDHQQTHLPSEGIGLDIVREILQLHGSQFGVEQKDEAIRFFFTLKVK